MKNKTYFFLIIILALAIVSCKEQGFKQTKEATQKNHTLDDSNSVKIKSYEVTFQPKSSGYIKLELENEAKYEASINGANFSSVFILLQVEGVQFNEKTKEIELSKNFQD